jgi:8-oxo-dGTP pyrophosphatase MutT (NUDIX family)
MYKIYFGERYLLITDKGINNSPNVFPLETIKDITEFVSHFDEDSIEKSVTIITENPQNVFNKLTQTYTYIEAAGGLVTNIDNEILLIYRYNKWDLPKGKREKGEAIEHCAIREVAEECGMMGHYIIKALPSSFHTYHDKKRLCLKQTFWFEMKYPDTVICTPQIEEAITQAIWVKETDLPRFFINTYPSIFDVVGTVFDL